MPQDTGNTSKDRAASILRDIFRDKASDPGTTELSKLTPGPSSASAPPDLGFRCPVSSAGVLGQGRSINVRTG